MGIAPSYLAAVSTSKALRTNIFTWKPKTVEKHGSDWLFIDLVTSIMSDRSAHLTYVKNPCQPPSLFCWYILSDAYAL